MLTVNMNCGELWILVKDHARKSGYIKPYSGKEREFEITFHSHFKQVFGGIGIQKFEKCTATNRIYAETENGFFSYII